MTKAGASLLFLPRPCADRLVSAGVVVAVPTPRVDDESSSSVSVSLGWVLRCVVLEPPVSFQRSAALTVVSGGQVPSSSCGADRE